MLKSRILHILPSAITLLVVIGALLMLPVAALAQDETPTPTPTETTPPLSLETDIPSYSDNSGATFSFDVKVKYNGKDRRTVNLSLTGPQGWISTVSYLGKQVSAIDMGPADSFGPDTKTVNISMTNVAGSLPDPGSYQVTLKATAGEFTDDITLTAIVKAKYSMYTAVDSGLLSMQAVAGKNNIFSFKVVNDGSSTLENIKLDSTGPTGWIVKFNPEKIDSLAAGQTQKVDVTINPPADKTIAGDYNLVLKASTGNTSSNMTVRVTVLTPSIWGWVGIGIVVVVIAGIMVLFMRLGRR